MRLVKVVAALLFTAALVYVLNRSWGSVPPLGKFLDPFYGFWQNAEQGHPKSQELSLPGLQQPVHVVYDSALIPHIFANTTFDLYYAQGFITASHRLWQMEFQTHAAAGRIAEIVGPAALDFDRSQRRLGMVTGAQNTLKAMEQDSEVMEACNAYTQGVNAYIASLTPATLPVEYKLLNYEPEPWTELKIGLFLMNMAKTLNAGENDLEMTNALALFGKETLDLLYPDREPVTDPIVYNPGGWNFKPVHLDSVPAVVPALLTSVKPVEKQPKGIGSNNWAVSGSKTITGAPILCSDPHLGLTMPSLWFTVHLHAPDVNTMGASFPGAPCVIIGFTDSVAWGPTNAQRDLVDWYKITFQDNRKEHYLSDGNWKQAKKVIEVFRIKGQPDFLDTITYTHHGPVTYDASFHGDNQNNHFAYRWIAHDGANVLRAFYELNRAKHFDDYMHALDHFHFPAQNFAFASVQGDIAIRIQGKYPVRRKDEGKFILDGSTTNSEWKAFIPVDQNIMMKNPARGFISSANQYPTDSTYPYYIHANQWEYYRNRRLNRVLAGWDSITPQRMMQLQNDNYNIQGEEYLPLLLQRVAGKPASSEQQTILSKLAKWDYVNTADSEAACYFEAWVEELQTAVWDEMRNSPVALPLPSDYMTWWLLKNRPDLSFYDHQQTPEKETSADVIWMAFEKALARVSAWQEKNRNKPLQWAYFKDSYVRHLLRLEPFSVHAINGGNSNTLNASRGGWGPSWRMVVSLERRGIKAWAVYPGGQSGNPGSRFYANQIKPWEEARPMPLKFVNQHERLTKTAYFTVQLNPAKP